MLSRIARSLHGMGVELERAEQLARILGVHAQVALDGEAVAEGGEDRFWSRHLALIGWPAGADLDPAGAVAASVEGTPGPSVTGSLGRARRACQEIRPSLPSEVFEQLNGLYWRLRDRDWRRDLHGFLSETILGCLLVKGVVEEAMIRDQARDFLLLGVMLERARLVTRLVTRSAAELQPDDAIGWAAVLRCATAFEAYRWRYTDPVDPEGVANVLLFDPRVPRSAAFALRSASESVRRIQAGRPRPAAVRALGHMVALCERGDPTGVVEHPGGFAKEFERLDRALQEGLRAAYFRPSRVAVSVPDGPLSEQPQQ